MTEHGIRTVEREAVVEGREPAQRMTFGVVQQVPRPVDDGEQRLVPVGRGAVAAAQQGEPVVEPAVDVLDRHRAHPGRRELDGQRQPVEPAHHAQHRRRGRGPPRGGRPGPAGRTARMPRRRRAGTAGRPARRRSRAGARVVVTTRRRGQDATRKATRSATASTTCSQLSRMSRAGAPARVCAVRARTSLRCSGVRIRRPLTESRTPRAEPTSPTTSSGEATPTSSTKCTTGCSASWPSRWASRVLPRPPGPRIETTRDSRTSGAQGADVVVATDQRGRLVAQPGAHRVVGGEQLGVHGGQRRVRGRRRAGRRGRGAPARTGRAPRGCRARRPGSAAGRRPSPRRRPRPPRAGGAPRGGRRGPTASGRARLPPRRAAGGRRRAGRPAGPSPPDAGARAGQGPPGVVAGRHPVTAALGRRRRRDVVAQGERVDRGWRPDPGGSRPPRARPPRGGLRRGCARRRPAAPWRGWRRGWSAPTPRRRARARRRCGRRPRRGPPAGRGCARRGPARRAR